VERITIAVPDGPALSALVAGQGRPLVMIPGWSQTAAEFGRNIEDLAAGGRRVIALDMRGHGESDKPEGGYRIARLARDLAGVFDALGLERADVLGHSMGSSVIWAYHDLFGPARLGRIVVVDQAPCVIAKPHWSDAERLEAGCLFPSPAEFAGFYQAVRTTSEPDATAALLKGMFTPQVSDADLGFVARENLKFPRQQAADLLHDHCYLDWRDTIRTLRNPTLVVGGETSIFSPRSQHWIAAQVPGAEVDIFPTAEGGGHFMFFENPRRFNALVSAFLAR
jgi:non-heme chloroperoxidase